MTQARYSNMAVILHWTIAVLLVWVVILAWQADSLKGMARMAPLQLHKPIGITIMLLTLVRVGLRRLSPPPPLAAHLSNTERYLAKTVHGLFYALLLLIPATGWAMVSASALITKFPINMFGLFTWPAIDPLYDLPGELRHARHDQFESAHKLLAKATIYGLIPLHVLGALKHQLLDRDDELARMLPFLTRKEIEAP